ncbi:ribokinase [Apilactobacillus ozensis DSM 23829 = JCM 17196]|uniref:Ribokinase n=2 Tax=Apilactobacillus ozensis TaxID=866801 RepID=A0A0R2ASP1_9LACO|nr:ribokinase [Apilactobacillus ozensis]KRM69711.1 ribokinase [Apilactobacillus ozensis DSM 23829 = JCM 17196]
MTKTITVLGSTNIDKVIKVPRFAKSGETLKTNSHIVEAMGGKGLNQAVATARSNAKTIILTKVGKEFNIEKNMKVKNLVTSNVMRSEKEQTGQAYITVSEETGDNIIHIYGGANIDITPVDVLKNEEVIKNSDFIIAQLEIPIDAVIEAFKIAKKYGVKTILNPAPMPEKGGLPEELLQNTDMITPNEHETYLLTGIQADNFDNLIRNANYYFNDGIKQVIITLGARGSFYMNANGENGIVPIIDSKVVDTTAAGDTFIGAMATRLNHDMSNLKESMEYATAASSITVSRNGAQPSIPSESEVLVVLGRNMEVFNNAKNQLVKH